MNAQTYPDPMVALAAQGGRCAVCPTVLVAGDEAFEHHYRDIKVSGETVRFFNRTEVICPGCEQKRRVGS